MLQEMEVKAMSEERDQDSELIEPDEDFDVELAELYEEEL